MIINQLYRVSSHQNIIEVDDVSSSLNKVSKKIILFENEIPDNEIVKDLLISEAFGTIIVVDHFEENGYRHFDALIGTESNLRVVKILDDTRFKAIVCLPEDYITFYTGQIISHVPKVFKVNIITLSDRAYRGIYKDESGPKATAMLNDFFKSINQKFDIANIIIPDNKDMLIKEIVEARNTKTDLFITTGGTGIGKHDITVETVRTFIGKEIPGIMEMIRLKYGTDNPKALLSCAIAGVMDHTLVFTLPGNPKAVDEYLTEIFRTLEHMLHLMYGIENH